MSETAAELVCQCSDYPRVVARYCPAHPMNWGALPDGCTCPSARQGLHSSDCPHHGARPCSECDGSGWVGGPPPVRLGADEYSGLLIDIARVLREKVAELDDDGRLTKEARFELGQLAAVLGSVL